MAEQNTERDYSDVVSRRKFVSLAGATGAAAVAGCLDGGDGGDDDDGGDGDGESEVGQGSIADDADAWFMTGQLDFPVDNYQYNPHPFSGTTHAQYGLWEQYTHYNFETGEFIPHLVTEWDTGETAMTLTLREDVEWQDGEPVDADSLMTQWDVHEETSHALFDFADSVEASDDYEITVNYSSDTNRGAVQHAILHASANMPPQDWDDYDGEGLTSYTVEEPTSSGPVVLTDDASNYHEYAPRSEADVEGANPFADQYNWNGYRMQYIQSNQAAYQGFINHTLDGLHSLFVQGTDLDRFPDTIEEITFPGVFGMGLWFNHDRDPWSQRAVRQAVAYSVDLQPILRSLGENKKIYHSTQTGLTDTNVQNWFGGYDIDGLIEYGQDTDEVESLLSEADLSLGEIQPTFLVPAGWSDWVLMSTQIADSMGVMGWDVTVNTLGGAYYTDRGAGDFDIVAGPHKDSSQHNSPFFGLRFQIYGTSGSPGNWSNYANPDDEKTVEIDDTEIDIKGTFEDLASTQDEDEQTELTRQLAMVVNRDLPYLHVAQKYEQHFIDRQKWAFPADHDLLATQWPLWNLPKTDEELDAWDAGSSGLLKAKEAAED